MTREELVHPIHYSHESLTVSNSPPYLCVTRIMLGEKIKIALVVASYFIVSISMVLMNKFLLSKDNSVPAPFFVTWYLAAFGSLTHRYQCVLTAIICWVLGIMGKKANKGSFEMHEM